MSFLKQFIFILLTFTCISVYGQKGKLYGNVSSFDNKSVAGATIKIDKTLIATVTNDEGFYAINNIKPGIYKVIVSAIGVKSQEQEIQIEDGDNKLDFTLDKTAVELDEVRVNSSIKKFAEKESEYVARMPLTNLENPQVYSVIPKELFAEQIATDYRIALMNAPGVNNVTQTLGSGGVGLSVRMRGFAGSAGTIRNGMNTNWVTMSDPVNLERIEVIKGPSATLFGSSLVTYGGLINRVTKKPFNYFKGEASYTMGNWSLSRTTVDINTPLTADKNLLFRVNAALDNQKTWQDYGRSNSYVVAPSLTFYATPRLKLDFELEHFNYKLNSTYVQLKPNYKQTDWDFKRSYTSNDLRTEQKSTNVFAKATYTISQNWLSETYLSTSYTDNKANYLFLLINNTADSLTRQPMKINSIFNTSQFQQNFIGKFNIGSFKNKLLVGAEYTYLATNDTRWRFVYDKVKINGKVNTEALPVINIDKYNQTIAGLAPIVAANRSYKTIAAYASDVINFTDNFLAMLSIRYSNYEDAVNDYKQNAISPKLGLVYQLMPKRISLFANYMNGYTNKAPGVTKASQPDIEQFKPEYANQLEGGVKFELLHGKLNGTVSYYDITVDNVVRRDPTDATFSIQDGTRQSKGLEFDLIANPINGLNLILGYGYNDSRYTKADASVEGNRPYATPLNVANAWLSYRVTNGSLKGIGFGVGGNYQDKSFFDDANKTVISEFTTIDGSVFYEHPKVRIGLKLNNATNKKYWTSDYWATPMPLRQLVANFTYKF